MIVELLIIAGVIAQEYSVLLHMWEAIKWLKISE